MKCRKCGDFGRGRSESQCSTEVCFGSVCFGLTHFISLIMPVGAALWRSLRAHQVYGANTDVGKTIVSTVLCNAIQRQKQRAAFLKPVSTGALDDADDR